MDDQIPVPALSTTAPTPIPYKNRLTGLRVFGILTILMGGLAALFVPLLLLVSGAMAARTASAPTSITDVLPTVFAYGLVAVVLIWLGIGSVMARRWARALLLIVSWIWLILGLLMAVCLGFLMPRIIAQSAARQDMPPGAIVAMIAVMTVILGILFIVIPAIWTLFYRSPHVKATCEARDPVARWTDACPLPVLAASLWVAFSALFLLFMPLSGHAVIPCFGLYLAGAARTAACVLLAGLWGYCAWQMYKLERRGWWLILAAMVLYCASFQITFAAHGIDEMHRAAGYSEAQIAQIRSIGLFAGKRMAWFVLIATISWAGYLLCIGKYFRRRA